jgi:serine/threonine protein kinase
VTYQTLFGNQGDGVASFSIREVSHRLAFGVIVFTFILGKLLHIQNLRPWPLSSVLHDKYLFPQSDADAISNFLLPMLDLDPDGRISAGELVLHEWLGDVPEIERTFESGHEVDAMKPVDDTPGEIPVQPPITSSSGVADHTSLVFEGDNAPSTPRPG